MDDCQTRVVLARVRTAHGTGGIVKLESFTDPPEGIFRNDKLRCELLEGFVRFESLNLYKGGGRGRNLCLAKIIGCDGRNEAQALQGATICLERKDFPPLDSDTFYHHALIGKKVCDLRGALLGEVIAVHNFGAGDILDVRAVSVPPLDKKNDSLFVPFSHESVTPLQNGNLEVSCFYAQLLAACVR